jgi:hypothetical protein
MVLPGETVETGAPTTCLDCHKELELRVLKSANGWYIGYRCDSDGPHSRESGYYRTEAQALEALGKGDYGRD